MSWKDLKKGSTELSEFGKTRFATGVAYLATVKADGSPRVHPITPIIGDDRLFLFMEPTSPKGGDLRRDGRYALHSSVADSSGEGGEFLVIGIASLVDDAETRQVAVKHASYKPAERYILFELGVDSAFSTVYDDDGNPIRGRWSRG